MNPGRDNDRTSGRLRTGRTRAPILITAKYGAPCPAIRRSSRRELGGSLRSPVLAEPSLRRRRGNHSGLDLAVAVGADEHALLGLSLEGGQGLPCGHGHAEGLGRWIYVMEVEIENGSVISTDGATPATLCDKNPLDLLVSARDRFGNAALAHPAGSSPTRAVVAELHVAVVLAVANLDWPRPRLGWRAPTNAGDDQLGRRLAFLGHANTCSHLDRTDRDRIGALRLVVPPWRNWLTRTPFKR